MTKLYLTNTLTKKKEAFLPLKENKVLLYACGVTPYDCSHIGHGRSYVFVDTLVRYLRFIGYTVTYVRNVTDIDDKLLKKAELAGDIRTYVEIAAHFTKLYQQEMGALNNLLPDVEPRVTDHIPEIIEFVKGLIEKNKAYVVDEDVYFDVSTYADYGRLSGKNVEDLFAGARVQIDERKRNPEDFALWKGDDKKLFWQSPWGYGRPGWHIECSALARAFLGESIDIHCGGADLIFPHHENERAQTESLFEKPFARYWVHNGLLNINKEKMSKSLGNILSLKDIFEKYDPMVLRYFFLQHHYHMPIDFRFEGLDAASVAYKKLVALFESVIPVSSNNECVQAMSDALSDDLNSPRALGILFEHMSTIRADEKYAASVKYFLQNVLGLTLAPVKEHSVEVTPEIEDLVKKREQARKEKDWALADKIREQLKGLGHEIQDRKL